MKMRKLLGLMEETKISTKSTRSILEVLLPIFEVYGDILRTQLVRLCW